MANHRQANVIYVDTTATFADVRRVDYVRYVGAASGTAEIREENGSGQLLWQESGTANVPASELMLRSGKGLHVVVTNGAIVYLYLGAKA